MKEKQKRLNDPLISLGTLIVALTLFYSLLFQSFSLTIDSQEFWKQMLFFTLLLITFSLSIFIFGVSQKGNQISKTVGVFILLFWAIVYLYFNKEVLKMASFFSTSFNQIIDSSISFGLAWLIIIPMFLFPLIGLIITSKLFKSLKNKKEKIIYWISAIFVAGLSYISVKTNVIIPLIAKIINLSTYPWLQILSLGISVGILVTLIFAPIYPLIFEVIKFWINFFKRFRAIKKH